VDAQDLDLSRAQWHKGSRSGGSGSCVEVARSLPGIVAVRDSKNPDGPKLLLALEDWRALTAVVKAGRFDLPRATVVGTPCSVVPASLRPGRLNSLLSRREP
jgi:hypothetical protein